MSARILTVAALLASVALRPAAAQGKTDFSGSWKINPEKSDPMGGGGGGGGMATAVTTITQTATQLTIETKFGDQTRTTTYFLDGKESTNQGRGGGETKSKTHWDGSSLVIESTGSFNGPNGAMTFTSKEVRTLGEDGKRMTVATTRSTPNGEVTTKRVYDKQ